MCGAPTVLDTLALAPPEEVIVPDHVVQVLTGGAPPPERVFLSLKKMKFHVTHIYGLTEVYGPNTICEEQDEWRALPDSSRVTLQSQQGVRCVMNEFMAVANRLPADSAIDSAVRRQNLSSDPSVVIVPVRRDGKTLGEVIFRGNIVMKGYLANPRASNEAFLGGWFHTGDVASISPDGYIQIKDRSKDVIISGGENISSIEVQSVIVQHPAVLSAAVVAMPHHRYGETPIAFVELRAGAKCSESELIRFCRGELAS